MPALSIEREALWKRVGEASFLTDDEKRAAAGYEPLPARSLTTLRAKYSPDQPRVPAGNPDGGQWTSGGEGESGPSDRDLRDSSDDSNVLLVADDDPQHRFSIDLAEEDKRGGHGHRDHVGKTDDELLDVLKKDFERRNYGQYEITRYREAQGSFRTLSDANDLVNQTIQANKEAVELVASGRRSEARFYKRFGFPTGKEAFRSAGDLEPYIRPTYGVYIIIKHDPRNERGYRVHTAFPVNR